MKGLALQLSVAVAVPVSSGKVLVLHSIVKLGGHVIVGAWLSSTIITCKHVLLLPHRSDAVQVLLIVRSAGQIPPIVTSEKVIDGFPLQLSVAVAVPVFAGKVLAVQSIVIFPGQVITGAWLSSTNMV
jgi:hypothetical protein